MKEKYRGLLAIAIVVAAIVIGYFWKQGNESSASKEVEGTQNKVVEKDKEEKNTQNKTELEPEKDKNLEADIKAEEKIENGKELEAEKKDEGQAEKDLETSQEFDFYIRDEVTYQKIMDGEKPIILMFGTKVCTYCNQMRPYASKLAEKYKDEINMRYIDAQEEADLAYKYPIQGVPAFMYKNVDGTGFVPSKEMQELLSKSNGLQAYSEPNSQTHDITMSYGLMSEEVLEKLIGEMINND